MARYMCSGCGHIYDESRGDMRSDIPRGTEWDDVPGDYTCPSCGTSKLDYEEIEGDNPLKNVVKKLKRHSEGTPDVDPKYYNEGE